MSTTKDDFYIMIILLQLILYILGKSKLDLYLILIKKNIDVKSLIWEFSLLDSELFFT